MRHLAGSTTAVLIAAVVTGCGGSQVKPTTPTAQTDIHVNSATSVAAWVRTSGPVRLVVTGPSTVHDLREWHAVVVNTSSQKYQSGGCISADLWPSTAVTMLSCLSGGPIPPHSRIPYTQTSGYIFPIRRPGLYRLVLTYWPDPGGNDRSTIRTAFAPLRVLAPVRGECPSSRKTCVYYH